MTRNQGFYIGIGYGPTQLSTSGTGDSRYEYARLDEDAVGLATFGLSYDFLELFRAQ